MERSLTPVRIDHYKPLREVVFEAIREAIITGRLQPGERLMEMQLAEDLGVSRTPVREAIRKLELEGFVLMIPRKGAYVADISMRDVSDVFEIRAALEGLAAETAAERATDEEVENLERLLVELADAIEKHDVDRLMEADTRFHEALFNASHNARLLSILTLIREQIFAFRNRTMRNEGRARQALDEHKAIVEAVGSRDSELARKLAEEHVESAENSLMGIIAAEQPRAQRTGPDSEVSR